MRQEDEETAAEVEPEIKAAAEEIVTPRPSHWHRRHYGVRFLGQGIRVTPGPVTGDTYRWPGHGAVVKVKAEDVDALVAMTRVTRGCCGRRSERVQQQFARV